MCSVGGSEPSIQSWPCLEILVRSEAKTNIGNLRIWRKTDDQRFHHLNKEGTESSPQNLEPKNTGLNGSLAVNNQRKQWDGSTSTMKGQGKIPMNCGTKFQVICYCSLTFYSLKTPIIFMSTCKSLSCCQPSRNIYQTISVDLGRPGFHSHAHLSLMSITVPQQFRMLSKEKVHVYAKQNNCFSLDSRGYCPE